MQVSSSAQKAMRPTMGLVLLGLLGLPSERLVQLAMTPLAVIGDVSVPFCNT